MKNFHLMLLAFLCFSNLQAQSDQVDSPTKIYFETALPISLQFSSFKATDDFLLRPESRATIFGLGLQQRIIILIENRWQFLTGLGVNLTGYRMPISNSFQDFADYLEIDYSPAIKDTFHLHKVKYNTSYISIPIKTNFFINKGSIVRFFLTAGLDNMILVKGAGIDIRVKNDTPGVVASLFETPFSLGSHDLKVPIQHYYKDKVNKYALDFLIGIGYDVKLADDVWFRHTISYQENLVTQNEQLVKGQGVSVELQCRYRFKYFDVNNRHF